MNDVIRESQIWTRAPATPNITWELMGGGGSGPLGAPSQPPVLALLWGGGVKGKGGKNALNPSAIGQQHSE